MEEADRGDSVETATGSGKDLESASGPTKSGLVVGVLFWVAIGVVIALSNDRSRGWIHSNWAWFAPVAAVTIVIALVGLVAFWAKTKSSDLRATVFLVVVLPTVALGTAAIFLLPTTAQLITLRSVAL